VSQGEKIYLQVLDRAQNGGVVTAGEVSFTVGARPAPRPFLSWTMIDVGFGDSHILTMPNTGKRIIIDGGERRDWSNVDTYLRSEGVTRLDVALATHVHSDHIGGLIGESYTSSDGVLGAYEIGRFLDTPLKSDMDSYAYRSYRDEILPVLRAKSVPIDTIRAGDTSASRSALVWDPSVGVEILNSGYGSTFGGVSQGDILNNDSVVLRVSYGDVNLVLGGDAEGPVTTSIAAAKGSAIDSEVLKVHHHGLDDSSPAEWVNAVNPRAGLIPITTYESDLGTLPSESVLIRLRSHRTDIYASDRSEPLGLRLTNDKGYNVTVTTDGVSYEVTMALSQSQHYAPGSSAPAMPAEYEVNQR
jgi:beta-lactamase superfamily II metal-dependent hydrolase